MDTLMSFDEATLVKQLQDLPSLGKVLFAVTTAERAYSGYATRWNWNASPEASVLRSALDALWRDLEGSTAPAGDLESKLQDSLALARPEDSLVEQKEHHRDDVVAAVCYSLRARLTGSPQEAAWAARRAYETLDLFVARGEDVDYRLAGAEDELLSSPLIQAELARQRRDITEMGLAGEDGLTAKVRMLRERAVLEGARFFG